VISKRGMTDEWVALYSVFGKQEKRKRISLLAQLAVRHGVGNSRISDEVGEGVYNLRHNKMLDLVKML
jgi:hypothetical protein